MNAKDAKKKTMQEYSLRYLLQTLPSKIWRVQKDLPKLKIVLTIQVGRIKEVTT